MAVDNSPKEHDEQVRVVQYLDDMGVLYCAIPNGFYKRYFKNKAEETEFYKQIAKLKAEGYKPGFPDLIVWEMRRGYGALIIEMKRLTGRLKPLQKQWIDDLRARGYHAIECKGSDKAIQEINEYLDIENYLKDKLNGLSHICCGCGAERLRDKR